MKLYEHRKDDSINLHTDEKIGWNLHYST